MSKLDNLNQQIDDVNEDFSKGKFDSKEAAQSFIDNIKGDAKYKIDKSGDKFVIKKQ